jgi:glycosyltransferase involved in cell wall biosynthesis
MASRVGAALIVRNEEKQIARCLQGVQWADEIVVVDGLSTDRTADICRQYGAKVVSNPWEGYVRQRRIALSHIDSEWVLMVDADEVVSPPLAEEIRRFVASDEQASGCLISRRNYFLGKWIRGCGWYPDYQLKLFRKDGVLFNDVEVHEGAIVCGKIVTLTNHIDHHTAPSLFDYIDRFNVYTSFEVANRLTGLGKDSGGWAEMIGSALVHFWKTFVRRKGYQDGYHGFLVSVLSSMYKGVTYAKVWEYRWRKRRGEPTPPIRAGDFDG